MHRKADRREFLLAAATGVAGFLLFDRVLGPGEPPSPFDRSRVTDVERAWDRIEAWMRAEAPDALDALRPGADDSTIHAAEEALGRRLPESFRRSVARHDGQEFGWPSLVESGFLMTLSDIVTSASQLEELQERAPAGPTWWRRGWVPFVSRDGDYLSLDRRGRIWCFLHDNEPMHSEIARNLGTWLERWADELEAHVFALDRAPGSGLVPRNEEARSRLWPD